MDHIRHSSIFDASGLSVTLVGAGGIGSMTALVLSKMGVRDIVIYDSDVVAPENLATQLHRLGTEGEPKAEALQKTLALFADDVQIYPMDEHVQAGHQLYGEVVISAVDSIQARKNIWQAVLNGKTRWYLDARMSAEEFQLYTVDMNDLGDAVKYGRMIAYEDDASIPDIPCTQKATFFCAAIAAGHIGATVRKILTGRRPAPYLVHNMLYDRLFALER
jgi:molybdopterin/thiamine biosynthesis adenylyltransferase